MTGTTAQWIAAIGTFLTALAAIGGVMPALFRLLHSVKEVHVIVNQQKTDMTRYQEALIRSLDSAGIAIPIDQSIPPTTEPTQ